MFQEEDPCQGGGIRGNSQGGNTPEFVKSWRELVEGREADEQKRRSMASLAVVFAELTGCQDVWLQGLEGFSVSESTIMRQMRAEGRKEGHKEGLEEGLKEGQVQTRKSALARLLRSKRRAELPAELLTRIDSQNDPEVLSRWFDLALESPTIEDFVDRMNG